MASGAAKPKEQKPIEQTLWDAANKLRGKVEPSEYKHVVLSMIFLKYANDRFDEHREQMIANGQQAFLEMMPFYTKDNVFDIPECARWDFIMKKAKQPDIAIKIDTALHEIKKLLESETIPSDKLMIDYEINSRRYVEEKKREKSKT